MDYSKVKFTHLQEKILNELFRNPTTQFYGKEMAEKLNVSKTAISYAVRDLAKMDLIKLEKKFLLSIKLNRENKETFDLKRLYNLKNIYFSNLINNLSDKLPGATIVLFGSYAFGEDTEDSDIDIAIIGYKEKSIDTTKEEKNMKRKIQLHFFEEFDKIKENLKENIINGIVLKGHIKL